MKGFAFVAEKTLRTHARTRTHARKHVRTYAQHLTTTDDRAFYYIDNNKNRVVRVGVTVFASLRVIRVSGLW